LQLVAVFSFAGIHRPVLTTILNSHTLILISGLR